MAGGVLKTLGGLLLAVGILGALAGGAAAAAGYFQEKDNRERGFLYDRNASEQNEMLVSGGLVTLGASVVAILLAVVLLAAGSSRANNAIRRDIRSHSQAAAHGTTDPAPSRRDRVQPATAARSPGMRVGVVAAALASVALLLLAAIALNQGAVPGLGPNGGEASRDAAPIERKAFDGTIQATLMQPGGSSGTVGSDNAFPYTPPAGTVRLVLNVTWDVAPAGTDRLDVQVRDASGEVLASQEGTGPLVLTVTDASVLGQELSLRVYPRGAGFVAQQDFHLDVSAWETV